MATKQKVLKALKEKHEDATLIVIDEGTSFQVQLEAPEGYHWENEVHCICAPEWYAGKRSEYWDLVLEMIDELPEAVQCTSTDDPCEDVIEWGECDYWLDEVREQFRLNQ